MTVKSYLDVVEARARQKIGGKRPVIRSAADLIGKEMTPVRYLVRERIPRGLVLLTGRPKMGKSWLALQTMVAAARGGEMLGQTTDQGCSLGLMLEDNDRRMMQRLRVLGGDELTEDERKRIQLAYTWRKGDEGVADLEDWVGETPDATLIVIDVLQKFRGQQDGRKGAYALDYAAMESLHRLASQNPDLTILIIHHNRKGGAEIASEKVSGTFGLTGAVDAYIILDDGPEPGTCTAHIDGRDWELWTHDFVWQFGEQGWEHVRVRDQEDQLTPARREWLAYVKRKGRATPSQAAEDRGVTKSAASQQFSHLERLGLLRSERGTYYPVT